ncbi:MULTISPECIES: hypothetical protein [Streptomyces]|uniref:hypothetical protein n=1 Tax=Streptomyces TaxID=1883 RepID=UPI0004CB626A|nr:MULTISPECIES: hypothetical protein [Streptomyces]
MNDKRRVTVIYTGMGDPHVHAAGCPDIPRTLRAYGNHCEHLDVHDAVDIAKSVYSDQINEGCTPEDLAFALDIKPCAAPL